MIEDLKERKEAYLETHQEIITRINLYWNNSQAFTINDILEDNRNDYYYRYMTKGIILNLIFLNYIDIIALYNGNKNYVYICKKEIKNIE